MKGYSITELPERSAIARAREVDISLKDAVNIAHHLKGKSLELAKKIVDEAMEKKRSIPYFRYLDSVSHRRGSGPGRYPIKALKAFKEVIENAEANAEFKSLDSENLRIKHIAATKGRMLKKYLPKAYGRSGAFFKDLVNIEIVLEEVEQ